jgi:hypothetical protein
VAGHWETDTGYWIVVSGWRGSDLEVWPSGNPPDWMEAATLSGDRGTLTFKEGNDWRHTLNLKNKYEASHEWFDLAHDRVWRTETMHKLIRASEEQKRQTQTDPKPPP